MWVLGVYVYLAVFYLIIKIDVNPIYKVNRRIHLILTFKSSASYSWAPNSSHGQLAFSGFFSTERQLVG